MVKFIVEWLPIEAAPIDTWWADWSYRHGVEVYCSRNQTIYAEQEVILTDGERVWRDYWVFESRGREDDDIDTDYWAIASSNEPKLVPTHFMLFPDPPKGHTNERDQFNFTEDEWREVSQDTVIDYIRWLLDKGNTA
jgi:hypothetical protein